MKTCIKSELLFWILLSRKEVVSLRFCLQCWLMLSHKSPFTFFIVVEISVVALWSRCAQQSWSLCAVLGHILAAYQDNSWVGAVPHFSATVFLKRSPWSTLALQTWASQDTHTEDGTVKCISLKTEVGSLVSGIENPLSWALRCHVQINNTIMIQQATTASSYVSKRKKKKRKKNTLGTILTFLFIWK